MSKPARGANMLMGHPGRLFAVRLWPLSDRLGRGHRNLSQGLVASRLLCAIRSRAVAASTRTRHSLSVPKLDVLVVADEGDPHSEAVMDELRTLNVCVARYNLADLNRHLIVVRPGVVDLVIEQRRFQITAATTVWWRRQGGVDTSHLDGDEAQLARDEGPHILRGALQSAAVTWADDPAVVDRAELKLFQLQAASKLGVRVPDSTVTNDPDAAQQFRAAKSCVAKALSPGFGVTPYTDRVMDEDVDLVANLPALLQEEITATADLRVVVVGGSAWLWRRARGDILDWRAEDASGSDFCIAEDDLVLDHARQITFALGLTMSVQDWLETDAGPVFLESNAQGNWLFLRDARTMVALALARHLVGMTEPDGGLWPPPWKRMLYDFLPKKLAPRHDGARAPHLFEPAWACEAAARPSVVEVAQGATDEASAGAAIAEAKASRLVQVSLSVLTLAFVVGGLQLRTTASWDLPWMLIMATPVLAAALCLTTSTFQALQIDRVGFYHRPSGESLSALGVVDPVARIVAEEEKSRQCAQWTSDHKHTDLMQARAWFTRGLAILILAAVLMLGSWLILHDAPTDTCDEVCGVTTEEQS